MGERISVVIPTWNRAAMLGVAIRSALRQSLPVNEVLVCDDCSTDDSRQVVDAINDPRVRWIEGARGGRPAIPRNRGIQESRGDWVAFLDDDDEWVPEKLERQLAQAKRLGCRAMSSDAFRVLDGARESGTLLDLSATRLTFADILQLNRIICSSAVVHRSLFHVVEAFPEAPHLIACEDYALWLRVTTQTDFAYLPEALLYYRDEPTQSVRRESGDEKTLRKNVLADFAAWAARAGIPGEYRKAAARERRALVLQGVRARCASFFACLRASISE